MWRAACMYFIAEPASANDHRVCTKGASSPAATWPTTRWRASPGTAGVSSLRVSSSKIQ